jgi:hypothetical protein
MVWANGPLQSMEFLVTVGLLMGVLLAGAVVIYFTDMWRKKQVSANHENLEELSMYREMYDNGELDEEEYRVIRDRLAGRMKADLAIPVTTTLTEKDAAPVVDPVKGASPADSASSTSENSGRPEGIS